MNEIKEAIRDLQISTMWNSVAIVIMALVMIIELLRN